LILLLKYPRSLSYSSGKRSSPCPPSSSSLTRSTLHVRVPHFVFSSCFVESPHSSLVVKATLPRSSCGLAALSLALPPAYGLPSGSKKFTGPLRATPAISIRASRLGLRDFSSSSATFCSRRRLLQESVHRHSSAMSFAPRGGSLRLFRYASVTRSRSGRPSGAEITPTVLVFPFS
jgi:hypothetical protein